MAALAILVSERALQATADRLRAEGVDFTPAPPHALVIPCATTDSDHFRFFPGLDDATSLKLAAALTGVTSQHLSALVSSASMVTLPFDSLSDGDGLFVIHGAITQLMFNVVAAPQPSVLGPGTGGPWVLFRANERTDGFGLQPLNMRDDELLPSSTAIMSRAASFCRVHAGDA